MKNIIRKIRSLNYNKYLSEYDDIMQLHRKLTIIKNSVIIFRKVVKKEMSVKILKLLKCRFLQFCDRKVAKQVYIMKHFPTLLEYY